MRKTNSTLTLMVITFLMATFALTSCTKTGAKPTDPAVNSGGGTGGGGGNPPAPTPTPAPTPDPTPTSLTISEVVTAGTWKITSYIEKTESSAKKFSNFTFTFLGDHTLIARDGGKITTGTWRPSEAIFYYGFPVYGSSPDGFFITLGGTLPLSLLGKNFFVSFKGLSTFTLESINPAEDTHVIFAK